MRPDPRVSVGVAAVAWRSAAREGGPSVQSLLQQFVHVMTLDDQKELNDGELTELADTIRDLRVEVLIGKRLSPHATGLHAVPGGWLEFGEDFTQAALRELKQETGLDPAPFLGQAAVLGPAATHVGIIGEQQFVTIYLPVHVGYEQEAQLLEPDKCAGWTWCDPYGLPPPAECFPQLREGVRHSIRAVKAQLIMRRL